MYGDACMYVVRIRVYIFLFLAKSESRASIRDKGCRGREESKQNISLLGAKLHR